jgi:hypothetical protein
MNKSAFSFFLVSQRLARFGLYKPGSLSGFVFLPFSFCCLPFRCLAVRLLPAAENCRYSTESETRKKEKVRKDLS